MASRSASVALGPELASPTNGWLAPAFPVGRAATVDFGRVWSGLLAVGLETCPDKLVAKNNAAIANSLMSQAPFVSLAWGLPAPACSARFLPCGAVERLRTVRLPRQQRRLAKKLRPP